MLFRFVAVICAFALGVGLRSVFEIPIEVAIWLLVLAFGFAILLRQKNASFLLLVSLCLVAISLGLVRTEVASWQFGVSSLQSELGVENEFVGVVASESERKEKTIQFYLETKEDKILVSTDRLSEVRYGDEVLVTGKLKEPESFITDLGREFDYPGYLKAKGIEYRISFADVEVIDYGFGNSIISFLLSGKQTFINSIERVIPEPAVGLGSGLLLGVKSSLGDDIETDFRKTGIIHIVVLSGYNVMLVVAFILFCFSFLLPLRARFVAGLIAIVCFALVVGLSATVVRASIMAGLVLFAQSYGKQYDVLRGLFLAGLVMLIINPYLLVYDIGFQLSFMATLGLLLIVPHFESLMITKKTVKIKEFFLATVATQIAVLPLLLYHIGEVSLIAVVVNVLVLPMVPVAMLLTFITGIIGLASIEVAGIVGYAATISLNYILWVAGWFASLPFASVVVPEFSAMGVVISYILMAGVLWWLSSERVPKEKSLSGWEIVEEKEPDLGEEKLSPKSDSDDRPAFFR